MRCKDEMSFDGYSGRFSGYNITSETSLLETDLPRRAAKNPLDAKERPS